MVVVCPEPNAARIVLCIAHIWRWLRGESFGGSLPGTPGGMTPETRRRLRRLVIHIRQTDVA